jgi:hypothetical protein
VQPAPIGRVCSVTQTVGSSSTSGISRSVLVW